MGGLQDAGFWGLAWAMFAATAGFGLAAAAIALWRRREDDDDAVYMRGYNALAALDR